jgi:hypothetical protein
VEGLLSMKLQQHTLHKPLLKLADLDALQQQQMQITTQSSSRTNFTIISVQPKVMKHGMS